MLNGIDLDYAIQHMCDMAGMNFAIYSQDGATNWPTPLVNISLVRHVVLPVHFVEEMHWGVIIVNLQPRANIPDISVTPYQPLKDTGGKFKRKMITVWEDNFQPWLKQWHLLSSSEMDFPPVAIETLTRPLQPDGTSCGLMVASMVYSRLISNSSFDQQKITLMSMLCA